MAGLSGINQGYVCCFIIGVYFPDLKLFTGKNEILFISCKNTKKTCKKIKKHDKTHSSVMRGEVAFIMAI
jgi:hypothetical protein